MIRWFIAILLMASGLQCSRQVPAAVQSAELTEPAFGFATDSITKLAELPFLRDSSRIHDENEIRIWTGFGVSIPDQLLRIIELPGATVGELYYWWTLPPDPASHKHFADFLREMERMSGQFGCKSRGQPDPNGPPAVRLSYVVGSEWMTVCRVDYAAEEPEWAEVLTRLRTNRVYTLPDPSTLTPSGFEVIDGVSIQVELLEAGRYRTYMYSNPRDQPWPEAVFADSLVQIVFSIIPAAR